MSESTGREYTLIAAGVSELADANPVQAGRVTPRKAFDGPGARVRHLAFDAGAVLAEHVAPRPILVSVPAGRVRFTVGGVAHELSAGGMIHVAANVPHEVFAEEASHVLVTLLG
ncbi:hypothetical protein FVP74_07870 [Microbacterium saccharophilum]|uniref:Cupin type-2 domain-containing protein n=1 Tax=Microbacterium saccharophilum TaxID=1213358 RepID=A0A5C8I111_9MICO|nr:cupin domain-containing protein [Microbacterium saccharophilum]TXK11254.1 hypothetical protein FVP74_07870 [Microbacterium saccharophilum]GEP48634.1 hypothetical protein MSA03_21420 [Microbacterium saccharophilum]